MISASCAGRGEERCGFARALPAPDHRDMLAAENSEIGVLASVRHQSRRQAGENLRPIVLIAQSGGDDDAVGGDDFAVGEYQAKAAACRIDLRNRAAIELRHGVFLEPFAVVDEVLKRQELVVIDVMFDGIDVERMRTVRARNMRAVPRRAQHHAFGHVPPPKAHRLAEHARRKTGMIEMRGDRESIGTRADDGDLAGIGSSRRHAALNWTRNCWLRH